MIKKLIYRALLCVMIFTLLPVSAHAIDRIDLSRDVHLTVHFTHEGQPLPGAEVQIYKVADMSEQGEFTLLEKFASSPVKMTVAKETNWPDIAGALDSFVSADNIQPTDAGVTDENGAVYFPRVRKPMEQGLYLLTGEPLTYKGVCYTPAPALIALPNREEGSDSWDYEVSVNIKYMFRAITETDEDPDPSVPTEPEKETDKKLPQTGNLWWPVPLMLIAGLSCMIAGIIRMRASKNEA